MEIVDTAANFWLMKTEPEVFSFDDLEKAMDQTTPWEGVRNYQARNFMRDNFRVGDLVLIYHSSCPQPGIAGIAEVVRAAYSDATAFDAGSEYYDEAAKKRGNNPWCAVDVKAVERFKNFLSLEMLRGESKLTDLLILRRGNRLSITPVSKEHLEHILSLGTKTSQ